uniref:Acyl-CoA dehydrogenase family member 11 n=1 Tax=Sander lucioperca TaxID=283035 RepID=A0A8C9ZTH5_SANLU
MEELTTPVRQQHKFSVDRLQRYLSVKARVSNNDTLTIRQYSAGQSNPTFLIQTPSNSYVLRKKPPGELMPGAHKMDREYRVQKALFSAGFPVPQPLLHCTDVEIIGTEFYLMEHVRQGRIFRDIRLPGVSPAERTALYVAAVEALAKVHSLDLASLNLEGYGKGSGYCKRQVSTWTKQYTATAHRDIPAMNKLSDWLMKNLPANDNEVTLVHGDFRLDNLIFHPTEVQLCKQLLYRHYLLHVTVTLYKVRLMSLGTYYGTVGLGTVYHWAALGRLGLLPHGIYARHLLGNASAPNAAEFSQCVEPLAKVALQVALSVYTNKNFTVTLISALFIKNKQTTFFYTLYNNVYLCVQVKAKEAGLWNLFLPSVSGLSQLDYAYIAEETGHCLFAPDVFNCQAPDTGNMEVLHMFGSEEQKRKWLEPLLRGEIRSCFCMTEPDVASSDATNMECSIRRDEDNYVINGKKWWSSGAGNLQCKVAIVMSLVINLFFRHGQHSMILVPMDTPGVKLVRPLTVFGQDDAIHGGHFEVHFENVLVPASNIILGEGRGFEIAQGRLGPGRLHHCMRAVGVAELALELLCQRATSRRTFGKKLYQHEVVAHWIAECRLMIEQTRLLTLHAAYALDTLGSRAARKQIAMIKVAAARMACKVVDCAIQVYGGAGVSGDVPLAQLYSYVRTLRIADGPDEVHLSSIAHLELRDQLKKAQAKL